MLPASFHRSVLLPEVMKFLDIQRGMIVIDGTLGDGGHTEALANAVGDEGVVIAVDRDPGALKLASDRLHAFGSRIRFVHGNFKDMARIATDHAKRPIDRILLDLGWSSTQFMLRGRGFSFLVDEPLDMRFDPHEPTPTAADILMSSTKDELVKIFRIYGEERNADRIAAAIVSNRKKAPIISTQQLAHLVMNLSTRRGKTHPATQIFQALRIAVNHEFEALLSALRSVQTILSPKGRIAIISFHSAEDRVIKNFFRLQSQFMALTKRPVTPSRYEIMANPRSRSARLRIFEKQI